MPEQARSVPPAGTPVATRTRMRLIDRWRRRVRADDRVPGDIACRNCGTDAPGAFCPACGQETTLRLPSAGQFMRDAAGRYVAFDGRMWRTLVPLLCRPGFLTREYLAGRRRRYIRPARLVLVLALVMFAVVRFAADPMTMVDLRDGPLEPPRADAPPPEPAAGSAASGPAPSTMRSGADLAAKGMLIDGNAARIGVNGWGLDVDDRMNIRWRGEGAPLGAALDRRLQQFNRLDRDEKARVIVNGMLRYGPYALIGLLPAFALLMQLLYALPRTTPPWRPRRYSEHLVYAAHNHAFLALAGTLVALLPWSWAIAALFAWTLAYLPLSMRRAYGGGWVGVHLRSIAVATVYAVLFAVEVAALLVAAVVLR